MLGGRRMPPGSLFAHGVRGGVPLLLRLYLGHARILEGTITSVSIRGGGWVVHVRDDLTCLAMWQFGWRS